MKDKLRELAERWKAYARTGCSGDLGEGRRAEASKCANELLSTLDAEGDGGAVGDAEPVALAVFVPGDNTTGNMRIWTGKTDSVHMFLEAHGLPSHTPVTKLYTHPARSGVVSDEDVEACVVAMKEANAARWNAAKDVTWSHGLRAALEHYERTRK